MYKQPIKRLVLVVTMLALMVAGPAAPAAFAQDGGEVSNSPSINISSDGGYATGEVPQDDGSDDGASEEEEAPEDDSLCFGGILCIDLSDIL